MIRRPLAAALAALLWLGVPHAASASVTITFWSHELGNYFPHAFITMRGRPDAGGAPVDMNIGFTARHVSPAILFGSVAGMLEPADLGYIKGSDAHFSVTMTDAQYLAILKLLEEWGPRGDQHYHMNRRNCVTFTKMAAERLGLAGTEQPKLMKRPRSYLVAVAEANPGRVTSIERHGKTYVAGLAPIPGLDPRRPVLNATGPVASALAFTVAVPTTAPVAVITAASMRTKGKGDEPAASGAAEDGAETDGAATEGAVTSGAATASGSD